MSVIGLTGCPGAGKTVTAGLFGKLGAKIISGDQIGKNIVESSPDILKALAETFGKDIINSEGNLKRRQLGEIAFSSRANLDKLNRIVHPLLLLELKRVIDEHRSEQTEGMLLVDAALIYEWGIGEWFDKVVTVYADYWLRLKRMTASGFSEYDVANRTEFQLEQDEKIRRANLTIENNGLLKELEQSVSKIHPYLLRI